MSRRKLDNSCTVTIAAFAARPLRRQRGSSHRVTASKEAGAQCKKQGTSDIFSISRLVGRHNLEQSLHNASSRPPIKKLEDKLPSTNCTFIDWLLHLRILRTLKSVIFWQVSRVLKLWSSSPSVTCLPSPRTLFFLRTVRSNRQI